MESNCKKTTYRTSQLALEDLERIKAKSDRDKVPKRVYKCKVCKNFHLTSKASDKDKIKDLKHRLYFTEKKLLEVKEKLKNREEELFKRIEENKNLIHKKADSETQKTIFSLKKQNEKLKFKAKENSNLKSVLNHINNYLLKAKKNNMSYDDFIKKINNSFKKDENAK